LTDPVADPGDGAPFALSGRVVTMNANADVLDHGAVYGRAGSIVGVRSAADRPPPGFEHVARVATRGTLFPWPDRAVDDPAEGLFVFNQEEVWLNHGQCPGGYEWAKRQAAKAASGQVSSPPTGQVLLAVDRRRVPRPCALGGIDRAPGAAPKGARRQLCHRQPRSIESSDFQHTGMAWRLPASPVSPPGDRPTTAI
jgi:hypothetical protein